MQEFIIIFRKIIINNYINYKVVFPHSSGVFVLWNSPRKLCAMLFFCIVNALVFIMVFISKVNKIYSKKRKIEKKQLIWVSFYNKYGK